MTSEYVWQPSSVFHDSPLTADPGYCADPGWANLIEDKYGYISYPISIDRNGELVAFAALTHIQHPIFGSYLVSAPYSSYGGIWFKDEQGANNLRDEIINLTRELRADYTALRFRGSAGIPIDGFAASSLYRTYRLNLAQSPEDQLKSFSSNHRNHVRRSLKKVFTLKIGGNELLDDAYNGLARSMRELGSPYHAKSYLAEMLANMPDAVDLAVVYLGSEIVGAGVFIRHKNEVINLHANILRDFRAMYAGEFFYWSVIEHYRAEDCQIFDLGRSLLGSGNEIFKSKWEPEIVPLNYWFYLPRGGEIPELNQKSPKFQIAIAVWKRMPQFLVDLIGPAIIRGIA